MKVLKINRKGEFKLVNVLRKQLIEEFSINNRDLRPLFLLNQIATIILRENCIIINLASIKLVFGASHAYIFNIQNSNIEKKFIEDLKIQIDKNKDNNIYFEIIIIEVALNSRFYILESSYLNLEKQITKLLESIKNDFSEENFEKLLAVKKRFSLFETKVTETQKAVLEIIEEEIDKLLISKYSPSKHEENLAEIESIFENHFEQVEDIVHKLDDLKENIDDTQEIITLKLASFRNAIIRLDLIISIITAALTIPAIVVGLYGMNTINYLEKNPYAFIVIVLLLILFLVLLFWGAVYFLRKRKIF